MGFGRRDRASVPGTACVRVLCDGHKTACTYHMKFWRLAPIMTKHPTGRPPRDATEVLRLTARGKWIKDDGKPGRAFSGLGGPSYKNTEGFAYAWYFSECDCWYLVDLNRCPKEMALNKTCGRFSVANGHLLKPRRTR